jgi:hypothetical protein
LNASRHHGAQWLNMRDDDDNSDLGDWQPLFGPHTPTDEVAELADRYAFARIHRRLKTGTEGT